jgi:hypothetical protein
LVSYALSLTDRSRYAGINERTKIAALRSRLSSEKQMPQVIVKKRKVKEATEGLERSRRLAKEGL